MAAAPFLPVILLLFLLLTIASRIPPALGAVPRFGALDRAAVLPGLAPRWYPEGIAAVPAQPVSLNPRYPLSGRGDDDDDELVARQEQCSAGYHSCVEANAPSFCCPNDRYCYLDGDWVTKCCSLGIECPGSVCGADQLYCNQTSAITVPVATTTSTASGGSVVVNVTSTLSYSTYAACCNRPCGSASFSCEPGFGGRCCPYEFKCAISGSCIGDPAPSTTAPGACAVPCNGDSGGGCCNSGSICTTQSLASATSTAMCVSNSTIANVTSKGLSSGAKAGIGVGVAVGAALLIAAATWVFIRKRGRSGTAATGTNGSAHEMRQNSGADGEQREGTSLLAGPMTPWTHRSTFTDESGPAAYRRAYFGPDPVHGPYTVPEEDRHQAVDSTLATTPPTPGLLGEANGTYFSPSSIVRPVELGGIESQEKEEDKETRVEETPGHDGGFGPFELMGSPGSPSPLTAGDKGPPSPFPAEAGAGEK
ncbi:hypothetical protein GGR51DRAFT_160569 [Nemania sp. FL0031]|nr:hypothetical protein GGR51DRAFT_160569 [Nemania sp. FL0031]